MHSFSQCKIERVLRRWPTFKLLCMCCTPFCCHTPFCRCAPLTPTRGPAWSLFPFNPPLTGNSLLCAQLAWNFNSSHWELGFNGAIAVMKCLNANQRQRPGRSGLTLTHATSSHPRPSGRCNFDIIFDKLLTKRLPNCWVNKSGCWFFDLVT